MKNSIYYKYYGHVYLTRIHLICVYIHRILMATSKGQFVPFKLGCSRRGYCWQLIASNIPSTSSNIAGNIKGHKTSFCLSLMSNFECEEVNLSFNFLYSFLNMSQLHEPRFSVSNINLL